MSSARAAAAAAQRSVQECARAAVRLAPPTPPLTLSSVLSNKALFVQGVGT